MGTAVLLAATLATGLLAGLYAAFWYAVLPGLARTRDGVFVAAMQGVNAAILNPAFGLCFAGAPALSVLAAVLHRGRPALPWILAGLLLHAAALVVTLAVSVPLNDRLAAADPAGAGVAAARAAFETAWVPWNALRTLLCLAGSGCLSWALVLSGRATG